MRQLTLGEPRLIELKRVRILRDGADPVVIEPGGVSCLDLDFHNKVGALFPKVGEDPFRNVLEVQGDLVAAERLYPVEAGRECDVWPGSR